MLKDLKKFIQTIKAYKYQPLTAPPPVYHDGLERLAYALHPKKQIVKVVKIIDLSPNVKLIRLVSVTPNKLLAPFRAGQYVGIKININGVQTGRAYSLVSSPNNTSYYEIAVKNLGDEGFVSTYLCENISNGDNLELTEPLGQFYYNPIYHGKDLLFIAGGCGVTPFISLMRNIYERNLNINVDFIYGCLTENDILFKDELGQMAADMDNFQFHVVLSEPSDSWTGLKGFITKDILNNCCPSVENKMIYIVGPDLMREFLMEQFKNMNISSNKIIWEVAPPIQDITKMIGWPSEISNSTMFSCEIEWFSKGSIIQKTIQVNATEPLLNGLERAKINGLGINNACRAGECGFCRSKLLSGKVFAPPNTKIREADTNLGYIHPCVSYPISDIKIEIYND